MFCTFIKADNSMCKLPRGDVVHEPMQAWCRIEHHEFLPSVNEEFIDKSARMIVACHIATNRLWCLEKDPLDSLEDIKRIIRGLIYDLGHNEGNTLETASILVQRKHSEFVAVYYNIADSDGA